MHFHVGIDGTTHDPVVKTSSGLADFDAAALQCVAVWKFSPATSNGRPIDDETDAEIDWGGPPSPVTFGLTVWACAADMATSAATTARNMRSIFVSP